MTGDADSTRYGHVASVLRQQIRTLRYAVGDELPPIATVAEDFDVSHMTVKQAFRVLADEGVLATRRGARARVVSIPADAPAPITAQLQEIQARLARLEDRAETLERHVLKPSDPDEAKP